MVSWGREKSRGEEPSKDGEIALIGWGNDKPYYVWVKGLDQDYDLCGRDLDKYG